MRRSFEIPAGPTVPVLIVVAVFGLALLGLVTASGAEAAYSYTLSSGTQTITVPFGVSVVTLDVVAGAGGTDSSGNGCVPGKGGEVQATVPVTEGQQLTLAVGGQGGAASGVTGGSGGAGGGGAGGSVSSAGTIHSAGGGGGGASSVATSDGPLVIAAGGGGCGAFAQSQGNGGNDGAPGGDGGTAKGGGAGAAGAGGKGGASSNVADAAGVDGSSAHGGAGAGDTSSQNAGGGGGGGGLFGGGGGGGARFGDGVPGGGGGGSDFVAAGLSDVSSNHAAGTGAGHITVGFNPPGVTVGRVFKPTGACTFSGTYLQTAVASGNSYTVPSAGVITSWWFQDASPAVAGLSFKVARPAGGSQWTIRSSDVPTTQSVNQINSYPARVPVAAGDVIGINTTGSICDGPTAQSGDVTSIASGDQQPNQTATYGTNQFTTLPVAAQVEPDTDADGYGDLSQDKCPGVSGSVAGCPLADLGVTQTTRTPSAPVGGEIAYTLVAKNDGPDAVSAVTVSDAIPTGARLVSATSSSGTCSGAPEVRCAVGTIASGATATVALVAEVLGPGTLTDTATIGSDTLTAAAANAGAGDRNPANDSATVTTQVATPLASLLAPFGGLMLRSQSATVGKHGKVSLSLSCPAGAVGNCVGINTLTTASKVVAPKLTAAKKKGPKVLTLGNGHFTIAAGKSGKVTIKLNKTALKLLAKKHTLKVKQTIVAHDARNLSTETTGSLKLNAAKPQKKR